MVLYSGFITARYAEVHTVITVVYGTMPHCDHLARHSTKLFNFTCRPVSQSGPWKPSHTRAPPCVGLPKLVTRNHLAWMTGFHSRQSHGFPSSPRPSGSGVHRASYPVDIGDSSFEVQYQKREADSSPQQSAYVMNE